MNLNRTSPCLKSLVSGLALLLFALSLRIFLLTPGGQLLSQQLTAGQVWTLAVQCILPQGVSSATAWEGHPRLERPPKAPQTSDAIETVSESPDAALPADEATADDSPNSEAAGSNPAEAQTPVPGDNTTADAVPASVPESEDPMSNAALLYTKTQADAIELTGSCTYAVDKASLLQSSLPLHVTPDGPLVLIVHTHTTEAYTAEESWSYQASGDHRTLDENYNMIRVGEQIAQTLQAHGIDVVHDKRVNDDPIYNGAYSRSYDCIAEDLAQYPTVQIVLDVHRDAIEDANGNQLAQTASIRDEECARLMLVVGTDEGGLWHPDWQENLSFALKLQAILENAAPGLCRPLDLRTERFNQQFTPGSLLVEVGASGNTMAQALRSADYLAEGLAALISAQKEA